MKAMVMSAGEGTRLRPLTYVVPKPLMPIVNRPVLGHLLNLMARHSIKEIVMNLHYYAEKIENYFKDGADWGVDIVYSKEKELLGTAGGVKKVQQYFNDTFFVTSGDGLTDLDFGEVWRFHKERGGIATIVLKEMDLKFEYGMIKLGKDGRVEGFMEKPRWSDVSPHSLVNTGIYIFEPGIFDYIPHGKFFDFGNNVWPLLLKKRERIYGYIMKGEWCDIGNLSEYRRGQREVLDGKINITIPGKEIKKGVWVDENTSIDKDIKIKAPCVIGRNSKIMKGAKIGSYATIGDNCTVEEGAHIENSILWNSVHISKRVSLKDCIVTNDVTILNNTSVFEGSVIGL